MAKAKLRFDNLQQSGDESARQFVANLAKQGVNAAEVEKVLDPITGKLIQLLLTLPESASQKARDAIAANPGIVSTSPVVPDPLFIFAIDPTAGVILQAGSGMTGVVGAENSFEVSGSGDEGLGGGPAQRDRLGVLVGDVGTPLGSWIFTQNNTAALPNTFIRIQVEALGTAQPSWTIQLNEASLKFDGGSTLVIANLAPIVVAGTDAFKRSIQSFWIDTAGKIYPHFEQANSVTISGPTTYPDAIALGAV